MCIKCMIQNREYTTHAQFLSRGHLIIEIVFFQIIVAFPLTHACWSNAKFYQYIVGYEKAIRFLIYFCTSNFGWVYSIEMYTTTTATILYNFDINLFLNIISLNRNKSENCLQSLNDVTVADQHLCLPIIALSK